MIVYSIEVMNNCDINVYERYFYRVLEPETQAPVLDKNCVCIGACVSGSSTQVLGLFFFLPFSDIQ